MTTEISRETRSRSEARKESGSYVQSEAVVSLLDDALSKQFEKFVVSTVIKESVHASLDEVIQENVMPLKKQIEGLSAELNEVKRREPTLTKVSLF
jgi:hypothetical protein